MLLINNYLKPFGYMLLIMAAMFFTTSAQGQNKDKTKYIKVTEEGTSYELVGMESNVVYNPYTYTWFAWEEPVYKTSKEEMTKMVPVSAFDRPPVFNGTCLTMEDQFECSNRKLREYVNNHYFDYPDKAQNRKQEGVEYVTFTLNENGKFDGNLRVVSKDAANPCMGCANAAADIVASMEDMWFPAIKDGETVKTELTIPVRFELLNR